MKANFFSIKWFMAFVIALAGFNLAHASDKGTPAEAEAMTQRAVAYIKTHGAEKAYAEFTQGKSFKDRDLYVTVNEMKGKNLAHGANPRLVGKDLSELKDADGKSLMSLLVEAVKDKGKGWSADYKFLNPTTQKLERKAAYVERLGDTLIGVGVYRE